MNSRFIIVILFISVSVYVQAETLSSQISLIAANEQIPADSLFSLIEDFNNFPALDSTGVFVIDENIINDTLFAPFVYYVPQNYDPSTSKPLLINLHGGVGRADFFEGSIEYARENYFTLQNTREWFILYPMGNVDCMWWDMVGIENIKTQINFLKNNFNLDDNRIFITGFSDGGSASFHLALNEPDYFASFYPLNGRLSVGHALTKLPVYIPNMMNRYSRAINTDLDQLYPAEEMRKVMELAQKAGADLFYKEYWDIGHEFLYAEQEIPIILGDMELHPRNVLRNDIYWETALPEFGKCDWIEIVEIDSTHNPASWHKNHEIELLNKRLSFGFYNDNDYKGNGSKVDNIVDGSAVDEMGIKAGDIIIAMDGQPASDIDELINLRNLKNRGDLFTLTIVRGEEELILNGKFPEAEIYQVFNYDMPSGAVSVKYFANQFHAETSRVGKLAVYIHPDMVNLDIPVTIFVNGLEVFNDIVQIDRDFMLHNFQENLDRKALWVNKLIIECN